MSPCRAVPRPCPYFLRIIVPCVCCHSLATWTLAVGTKMHSESDSNAQSQGGSQMLNVNQLVSSIPLTI